MPVTEHSKAKIEQLWTKGELFALLPTPLSYYRTGMPSVVANILSLGCANHNYQSAIVLVL